MTEEKRHPREVVLVHTGDVHLSNSLPHARVVTKDGRTDRLEDQVVVLKAMLNDAAALGAAGVILAGDVVDESTLDGPTLDALTEVILHARVPLAIGPGNHESSSPRGGRFVSQFLARLAATLKEGPETGRLAGRSWHGHDPHGSPKRVLDRVLPAWLKMWWVDYCPPEEAARRIALIPTTERSDATGRLGPSCASILWLHHAIKDCQDGSWPCSDGLDGDEVAREWTQVISGHFHEAQAFGIVDGRANGFYMGSTMELDFGDATATESSERGWWRMRVDPRSYEDGRWQYEGAGGLHFEQVTAPAPRFHVAKYSTPGGVVDPFPSLFVAPGPLRANDYLRVEVQCTHAEWASCESEYRRVADKTRERHKLRLVDVQPKFIHRVAEARLGEGVETADKRVLVERFVDATWGGEDGGSILDRERLVEVGRILLEEAERT